MVHCQFRSLFAATASRSLTSRPPPEALGGFGSRGHGHSRACVVSTLKLCSSSTPVPMLVTQTLVQTPEPKFSPSGSQAHQGGAEGGGSRRTERRSSCAQELLVTHLENHMQVGKGP